MIQNGFWGFFAPHSCNDYISGISISNKNHVVDIIRNNVDYNSYICHIKSVISNPDIKYVSFDVFDTLIERPVLRPTDIFSIVESVCKRRGLIDNFIRIRNVEGDCKKYLKREPSLNDIYDYIKLRYNIDNDILNQVKNIEQECEFKLLKRRSLLSSVYDYAVSHGKKIICVSDMYLSSEFILSVLNKEGYNSIERVFVSNEFNATKRSGSLFNEVFHYLNISSQNLIHIGDNLVSDYKVPLKLGVCSFCIPSSYDLFRRISPPSIFEKGITTDPFARIAIGYFVNLYSRNNKLPNSLINNLDEFIMLCIALPMIILTLQFCFKKDIQNNYSQILFASRDGYLIKCIYDIFKSRFNYLLDSRYVYTGRKSYFTAKYETFDLFLNSLSNDISTQQFLKRYVYDEKLVAELNLSGIELNNVSHFASFINKNSHLLAKYYENHRNEAIKYYNSITSNSEREIIFDIGYNGSVSSISHYINKIVDKIYFRETSFNKLTDKALNSRTYCLFKNSVPISLIPFEELLAPLEGSTIGYVNCKPILEHETYSDNMIKIYSRIKYIVCDITQKFINDFDMYAEDLMVNDSFALFKFYHSVITNSCSSSNFINGCVMKDTFGGVGASTSLLFKMFSPARQKLRSAFELTTVRNPCYYNYDYSRSFYDFFCLKKIAIYLDIDDVNKIPYIITKFIDLKCDFYINAPMSLHGVLSNLFVNRNYILLKKAVENESLFSWLCNAHNFASYDSVLVVTTPSDAKYYPLSEFLNNINGVLSPFSLMQVSHMIDDSHLAMLSLPFTKVFEQDFNYMLYSDKATISLVTSFFSWCKNLLGPKSPLDDYPIELNEYAKLFNESFWYCPKKMPNELWEVLKFEDINLFTNQRLSVLIPILLNRINDHNFRYFSS